MTSLFSYVELHTQDVEKSQGFYAELFGWKFAKAPTPPGVTYFGIKGRAAAEEGGLMKDDVPAHWLAYVHVEDIAEAFAKAQKLGAKVLQPITKVGNEGTMAKLSDPTGAVFALWQPPKA